MSIEQDLKRMADANERIAEALEFVVSSIKGDLTETVKKTKKAKETPVAPAVPEAPPAVEVLTNTQTKGPGIAAFVPIPPVTPVVPTASQTVVSSGEELRLMAQKIAQKLGANTLPFVQWVNGILAPYGVQTVVQVPADKIQEVAQKLDGYAKEKGITY